MQRDDARNAAFGERGHDRRRETSEMVDVSGVRLEIVDRPGRDAGDRVVLVGFRKRTSASKRVVDADDPQPVALLGADVVFGAVPVVVTRQHQHLVAVPPVQCERVRTCIEFGAALRNGWKAMNDEHDAHQAILDRRRFSPRAAELPPRYWPSGHTSARASACALRSRRQCRRRDEATARPRSSNEGIVRRPNSAYKRRCSCSVLANSYLAERSWEWIDLGTRHVRQLVSRQQDRTRPLEIFGNRGGSKRMRRPDAAPDARADVVERALLESRTGRQRLERRHAVNSERAGNSGGRQPAREIVARDSARLQSGLLPGERAGQF